MNISSAQLFNDSETGELAGVRLVINEQQWSVPISETNRFYQMYLKWVAEGNTPDPAE